MQEQDKELFQDYEIKNWNFSPRLYKILGAAAIFNLLTLLVLGQTNLLTTKGCDSPFVSTVCQVLDTVYVGSALFNTDTEFVSKDYEKTELEDADITYIDVSGQSPPLKYPEGYFALANPEEFAAMQNPTSDFSNFPTTIPGFPSNPTIGNGTDLLSKPQVVPTPNNNAISGNIPVLPYSISPNPVPPPNMTKGIKPRTFPNRPPKIKTNNSSPKELPKLEGDTTAEKKDKTDEKKPDSDKEIKSDPVADIEINKKPFEDLGDFVNEGLAKKEVDLNKPFLVVMDGVIAEDGKLDPKKSKFVKAEGDEKMSEVARQAIEAVGNSGFLGYLKKIGIDKVNFTLVQDDKQINVIILSEQKDLNKAKSRASDFNLLLSGVKFADANGLKKLDENSKTLIENSKITSQGKNFVLNFALPKQTAQEIITKTLKDRAEKKAAAIQPNSSAELDKSANANIVK